MSTQSNEWYASGNVDYFGLLEVYSTDQKNKYVPYYPVVFQLTIEDGREWTMKTEYYYSNNSADLNVSPKISCSGQTECNAIFTYEYESVTSDYTSGPKSDADCTGTAATCGYDGVDEGDSVCDYDLWGNNKCNWTGGGNYPQYALEKKYSVIPMIPFCDVIISFVKERASAGAHRPALPEVEGRAPITLTWEDYYADYISQGKIRYISLFYREYQGINVSRDDTISGDGAIIEDVYYNYEYSITDSDNQVSLMTYWSPGDFSPELPDELALHSDVTGSDSKIISIQSGLTTCNLCLDITEIFKLDGYDEIITCKDETVTCVLDDICNGTEANPAQLMNPALQGQCTDYCYDPDEKTLCKNAFNHLCGNLTPEYLSSDLAHEYEKKYCGCWMSEAVMDDWFKEKFFDNNLLSTDGIENENVGCIYTECIDSTYKFQGYNDCKSVTYCINQVDIGRDLDIGCEIGEDGTASCGNLNLTNNCGSGGDSDDEDEDEDEDVDYTIYIIFGSAWVFLVLFMFMLIN